MGPFWTLFCARIQQRWVFAVMGSLAVINAYTMRICLSLAITEMVKPIETSTNHTSQGACPEFSTSAITSNPSGNGTYEWDEYTQGIILSSFYWGYIVTQIPGGLLSERFGGKHILGLGILSTGILTVLTPIVVEAYGSMGLIVLRCLMGIGEGSTLPAVSALIAQWAPSQERTKISTLVTSGIPVGTVLGNALSGVLIRHSSIGWPVVFYFFGFCAILWFFAWIILCYSRPDAHPFITEKEKRYLDEAMSQHTQRGRHSTPWWQMMTSVPVWTLLIGHLGFTWSFFTMASDLPKYMSNVLKFSIQTNGFLSALPYILTWVVSNAASWLADWLIKSEKMSRTTVRKVLNALASVLSATFLIAASYAECNRILVVIFFTLGVGMMGFYHPSLMVNPNDLSPNYSGTLMAFVSSIAALNGTLAPYVAGILTAHQSLLEWRIVFWISFVISGGASLIFTIWADGEIQHWNNAEPRDRKQIELRKTSASVYCAKAKQSDGNHIESDIPTHTEQNISTICQNIS